jgi:hypothetical protein
MRLRLRARGLRRMTDRLVVWLQGRPVATAANLAGHSLLDGQPAAAYVDLSPSPRLRSGS